MVELAEEDFGEAMHGYQCYGRCRQSSNGYVFADNGNYTLDRRSMPQDLEHLVSLADVQMLQTQTNTTLAVIGTNIAMERYQLMKVAELAHDGMARAVFPVHSTMDGDTVFALSSLSGERKKLPMTEQTVTTL